MDISMFVTPGIVAISSRIVVNYFYVSYHHAYPEIKLPLVLRINFMFGILASAFTLSYKSSWEMNAILNAVSVVFKQVF